MNDFSLIETMLWQRGSGIARLDLHLARLKQSARQLGFPGCDRAEDQVRQNLADGPIARTTEDSLRLRLTFSPDGQTSIETAPFALMAPATVWRVAIAGTRLESKNPLLRHKTTRRHVYEAARSEYSPAAIDEVLLLNEKGEPCEGTITSIFLDDGSGMLKTPPLSNGLLAGVLRTDLLCRKQARIERLTIGDIERGTLYLGNALRGLVAAKLVTGHTGF